MTFAPRLEEITPGNFETATGIRVRPEQEFAVSPVMQSLAEAYVHRPGVAWPRLIVDGDRTVGFLMAFLDIDWNTDGGKVVRSGLWRLNIAADAQGRGYGRFAVESYLQHAADKLVRRFDAGSYVVLTEAMNAHDVGRGRGGTVAALRRVTARTAVVAIDSDRLYPVDVNREIADAVPGAAPLTVIPSPFGHDAFLIETGEVAAVVGELLGAAPPG